MLCILYFSEYNVYSKPLKADTDILFFLDSSRSVSSTDYDKEKDFIKALTQVFLLKGRGPRAGLIVYGASAKTVLHPQNYTNRNDFNSKLYGAPRIGGSRNFYKALHLGIRLFSSRTSSGPNIAILLTSGENVVDINTASLQDLALSRTRLGVNIYVVAIGSELNKGRLLNLVPRPGDLVMVDSYDTLASKVQVIARHVQLTHGMLNEIKHTSYKVKVPLLQNRSHT